MTQLSSVRLMILVLKSKRLMAGILIQGGSAKLARWRNTNIDSLERRTGAAEIVSSVLEK